MLNISRKIITTNSITNFIFIEDHLLAGEINHQQVRNDLNNFKYKNQRFYKGMVNFIN